MTDSYIFPGLPPRAKNALLAMTGRESPCQIPDKNLRGQAMQGQAMRVDGKVTTN